MSKTKKKTLKDHSSLCYRDGESNKDFVDKIDYEISSILLELSHPVVFSSDSLCLPQWGRTKKRSTSVFLNHSNISSEPVIKPLPSTEVTSSSSCLTGEAKKTNNPQTINKGFEENISTKYQMLKPKISSQPNVSRSALAFDNVTKKIEVESLDTSLLRAHVALVAQAQAQPFDDQNLRHLQPLTSVDRRANFKDVETASVLRQATDNFDRRGCGFDLNLPATEEVNPIAAMVGFQRVATGVQAATQARQKRLALMRSKKLYSRFISSYQFNLR